MKKLSKKSLVAIALVVAIGATVAIGGTLAFFTDTTDTALNTFTMGKVDIDLTETSVADEDNNVVAGEANNDNGFDYTGVKPGFTYSKIPTITVQEGSEDCWVFTKMSMTKYVSLINLMMLNENATNGTAADYTSTTQFVQAMLADKTLFQSVVNKWFSGITHEDWKIMNLSDLQSNLTNPKEKIDIILGYQTSTLSEDSDGIAFMDGFIVPATVTGDMMAEGAYANGGSDISGLRIWFTGYAIQADGLADIDAAYNAMGDLFTTT